MSKSSKHEIICKIITNMLNGWTKEDFISYVFDKEYDEFNKMEQDELMEWYKRALISTQRRLDLTLILGSYRADLLEIHGDKADEHIQFINNWIVEVEEDQEYSEGGIEFEPMWGDDDGEDN